MATCKIADIIVAERIREDMGNIKELAESIGKYGLLHPVVVDANRNLVAGGRRLAAVQSLGWTDVEVRFLGELSDRERRMIEVEENIRRKDLTEYERSQRLTELMEAVKDVVVEERSRINHVSNDMSYALTNSENGKNSFVGVRQNFNQQTSSVGRPAKNDVPLNEIAQRIGIPRTTLVEARQHVDTVKEIPALESQPKQAVIQVGRELKKITDPVEREQYKEVLTIVPELVQTTTEPENVRSLGEVVAQMRKEAADRVATGQSQVSDDAKNAIRKYMAGMDDNTNLLQKMLGFMGNAAKGWGFLKDEGDAILDRWSGLLDIGTIRFYLIQNRKALDFHNKINQALESQLHQKPKVIEGGKNYETK